MSTRHEMNSQARGATVRVTLRYFALWRDILGRSEEIRAVVPGTTVGELRDAVSADESRLVGLRAVTMLMVNQEYTPPTTVLNDGDELAFIPPVSGGSPGLFRVVETPLEVNDVIRAVATPGAGAIVTFTGTVRDHSLGKAVTALTYEAYPAAAEKMLTRIGAEIAERWPVCQAAIVHRTGRLAIGEASVVIAVSAPHRHAAFEACEYAIVRLKEIVPIWKQEAYTDGAVWIGSEAAYPRTPTP